jgi:hypothetical protein
MTESGGQSRRIFLANVLGTGVAFAALTGSKTQAEPVRTGDLQMFASWVHGNAAQVEKREDVGILGDDSGILGGDDALLGGDVAGGALRFGWGAEMYIRGRGPGWRSEVRSGTFWVHYAIPTPVIESGRRSVARDLLVRWRSPDNTRITFDSVHVWDGDARFFARDGVWGDPEEPLRRIPLGDHAVNWGIGVSLHVRGNSTTFRQRLVVHSVGVDFFA